MLTFFDKAWPSVQAAVQERRPRQVEKVECCLVQARGVVAKFDGLLLGVASHLQVS